MMKRIFGLLLALVSGIAMAAPAAYVHELQGEARASTRGIARTLQLGSTLESGDEVSVGKGTATLKFEDGQIVALQQGARFAITNYQYNKAKVAESNVVLSLITGGMRFLTGVIGGTRRDAIALRAGTATIGIRGTDVIMLVDAAGQVLATVQDGVVAFTNQGISTALNAGQGSTAAPNQPPVTGRPVSQLPPGLVNNVANLGQKTLPANNPVSVTASADLVKAVADANDKAQKAAAAEKAAAEAKTAAEIAKANADLAAAKAAAAAAAADAAAKAATEAAAAQQAKQVAVQAGAPTSAGTTPPIQGTGVGLTPTPTSDPATTVGGTTTTTTTGTTATPTTTTEPVTESPLPPPTTTTPTTTTTTPASPS